MIKIKILKNGKEIVKYEKGVVECDVDDLIQWHARKEGVGNYIVSTNFPELEEEIYYDQTISEGEIVIRELRPEEEQKAEIEYWANKNRHPFSGTISAVEFHTLPSGHRFTRKVELWRDGGKWWIQSKCCPGGWAVHGIINRCVSHGSAKISLTMEEIEGLCWVDAQKLFQILSILAQRAGVSPCWIEADRS
jgi:hypothetical protein